MAITKTLMIDGQEVKLRASASIPRIYRILFQRDMFSDMEKLVEETKDQDENKSTLSVASLEIFENVAFVMAKHADPSIENIDDWLDQFNTFSIYKILPEIVKLWGLNLEQESTAKKKSCPQKGK